MTNRHTQLVHTPTGALALVHSVAEKLLKEGVISGTLDGQLHATDAATVKAGVMAHSICDFCSVVGASHLFDVPDFVLPITDLESTGGWMACDACADLISTDNKTGLLKRSIDTLAFPKFSRTAIKELHDKFWQGLQMMIQARGISRGVIGFINDEMLEHKAVVSSRDERVALVSKIVGIPAADLHAMALTGKEGDLPVPIARALIKWHQTVGKKDPADVATWLLKAERPPLPPGHVPHWQQALDARFEALQILTKAMTAEPPRTMYFPEPTDLQDPKAVRNLMQRAKNQTLMRTMGFGDDIKYLRVADTYSFNPETTSAIQEAANSIPHETPLSSIETPNTGAGWFWFADPLTVTASPLASEKTHALLWAWTGETVSRVTLPPEVYKRLDPEIITKWKAIEDRLTLEEIELFAAELRKVGVTQQQFDAWTTVVKGSPAIMFSAYVLDEKKLVGSRIVPIPSTRWFWPLEMTFHEMIAFNGRKWLESYGPGAKFEHDANVMGKDMTLKCIADLSLFFLAACVWFKQKILIASPGHVERHARKRMQREHKLSDQPSVRVIALRASMKEPKPVTTGESETKTREYHVRWIVRGHHRLQHCGPGRKDRKLIFIAPHPAGPADKPLRTRETVYAVIR